MPDGTLDPKMDEIRDLVDRVVATVWQDIVFEDPDDLERARNTARHVLLEIGKTHFLWSKKGGL